MACVKMIQTSKHKWRIETLHGIVLLDDITIDNRFQAEAFVISYISSYIGWTYEVLIKEET